MNKRYQIFISSTFADLSNERQKVIRAVMELDGIPSGMELFPAADEEQFEFIKSVINDCDYYVLIIGGRYGSMDATGVSYTEKEYDYAVGNGLHVIALVHEKPGVIPAEKSELDEEARRRLLTFRSKVCQGRLVKFWTNADQLAGLVVLSISRAFKVHPAVGWIRADRIASEEILAEINSLRKENESLKASLTKYEENFYIDYEELAEMSDEFEISGTYKTLSDLRAGGTQYWKLRVSWNTIFATVAPDLEERSTHTEAQYLAARKFYSLSGGKGYSPRIDVGSWETITIQLRALGLAIVTYTEANKVKQLVWELTNEGKKLPLLKNEWVCRDLWRLSGPSWPIPLFDGRDHPAVPTCL